MTKLLYVGDGTRYLDGVPAADHETEDEETIAIALQSGLYTEEAAEGEPPKKKKNTEPPPVEGVSATDEGAPAPAE